METEQKIIQIAHDDLIIIKEMWIIEYQQINNGKNIL